MKEKVKCKGCSKLLKPEDMTYKINDMVIIDLSKGVLNNSGTIEPFCFICKVNLLEDTG